MDTLGLVAIIVVLIVAFALLRKVMLWYWRVNDLYDALTDVRDELRRLNAMPRTPPTPPTTP